MAEMSRPRAAGNALGRLFGLGVFGGFIARLARSPTRARWLTTRVTRLHGRLLHLAGGRLRRSWLFAAGQPVMALTTIGRRSGASQTTAVAALCHEGKLATVGMNLGSKRNPAWSYNLEAHPDASITIRGTTIPVTARRTEGEERDELWRRWLNLQPSAEAFAELSGRDVPVFVLERRADRA